MPVSARLLMIYDIIVHCQEMELDDAIHIALLTLRESYEGEMTEFNIEVGIVAEDGIFRILTPAEVRDYLDEAN